MFKILLNTQALPFKLPSPIRYLFLGCSILLLASCVSIDIITGDDEDEIELITWSNIGPAEWEYEDGEWSTEGAHDVASFLVSQESYGNFRLTLEFWINEETNSGLYLRCPSVDKISPVTCYEVNIWDNHADPESRTGSIVLHSPPLAWVDTVNRWNTMEVVAKGSEISASINGVQTSSIDDQQHQTGLLAIQYGNSGGLKVRVVEFERLAEEPEEEAVSE